MQLVNIGFGNLVSVGRLIAVVSPDSAPIKRLIQESRDRGMLIDATYGRKTAAVLVMDRPAGGEAGPPPGPVGGGFHAGGDLILEKQGKIFILSGPSGSGKGTVLKSAMREHPDMFLSVSATTRGPRQGEIDGVHYHFISDDAFLKMIDRDQLLEHAGYAGNFYGTPRIPVDEALDQGRDVMLEIDVQGAQQVYAKRPDAVRIFLAPPSWSELERRLVNRGTDSADKIRQRLTRARDEMALAVDYDYFIINDDVERAAAELNDIFRVEHFKPAERMHLVKD